MCHPVRQQGVRNPCQSCVGDRSVRLVGTEATFVTATLSKGSHTITAAYSGDASIATSTSAALT